MANGNDFDRPQPRGQAEMGHVAAEALGMQTGKPHSPRFHRMSIASAENGYSVEHSTPHEPTDNDRNRETGDSMQGQGPSAPEHDTKTHLITSTHPAYHHIHAIHESLVGGTKPSNVGAAPKARGPQNR